MSSINKFVIYQCDVCGRQTEITLDGKRPDPVRCNITYACRGRLQKTAERSVKQFLLTPPVAGLQDYIPRGTIAEQSITPNINETVSLMSGLNMISAAFVRRQVIPLVAHIFYFIDADGVQRTIESTSTAFIGPRDAKFQLGLYEISDNLIQYKKYIFLRSGMTQMLVGLDNSPAPNAMYFTPDNFVRVFVNGVELTTAQFNRDIDGQIMLTPAVFDTSNVIEIFVYSDLAASYAAARQVVLEFDALDSTNIDNLPLLSTTAWGDHLGVGDESGTRFNVHCLNSAELSPDRSYGVLFLRAQDASNHWYDVLPSEVHLLLANAPYAYPDKQLYAYVSGSSLLGSGPSLAYAANDHSGLHELVIRKSEVTNRFNPLTAAYLLDTPPEQTIDSSSTNVTLSRQYILGPV